MGWLTSKRMKYFITAIEEKNINKAAESLFISRTPLVNIIKEIESYSENVLFNKSYNDLNPTEYAISLYERIKPIYDKLLILESDMACHRDENTFEIVFDISIPEEAYRNLITLLQIRGVKFTYVRIKITNMNIDGYTQKENVILVSMRRIITNNSLLESVVTESRVCLIKPKELKGIKNKDSANLPVLLKSNKDTPRYEAWIKNILQDDYPLIDFEYCHYEYFYMLFKVSNGDNMMILPEKIAKTYRIPNLDISLLKNQLIKVRCYHLHSRSDLGEIFEIINEIF
ncbi:LysR family transcriptional regulator [Rahnella aquatilis]|uniref:LysR family transcriptional regulator n=1 Tax=Rahnella aquatilis TaxID=34038 RepID=UPI0006470AC3|nr:LysR family transcriptional regulator [Rahnella aquatilis]